MRLIWGVIFFSVQEMVFYVHPDEEDIDEMRELEATGEIAVPEGGYITLTKGQTYKLKRWATKVDPRDNSL